MTYKYDPFQHCCSTMNKYLDPNTHDNGELLEYSPDIREYRFILHNNGEKSGVLLPLIHCPWSGKKLPEDLSYKFEEVLEEEYGITEKDWDAPGWNDDVDLPPEFKTDEWWKKRGL